MKTIVTLLLVLFSQGLLLSQNSNDHSCTLTYSDNKWSISHTDTINHQCSSIAIKSLPPVSQTNTPMNLFITTKGTYSLKKDGPLLIPNEYNVVIEDLLTGQYYDLRSTEPYTFNLNRGFNQTRFVLEVSKTTPKMALGQITNVH